jgi:Nucleotidyltransferase domain
VGRPHSTSVPLLAGSIAERLAQIPSVWAVVLGGSHGTETADLGSDVDLYVYAEEEPSLASRLDLARAFSRPAWVGCTAFGPGDEWPTIGSQPAVDLIYWTPAWIEEQLARVLDRYEASVGYSTCFWHTVRQSVPLFDRDGWFERLQGRANCAFPDGLRVAIIAKNFPLLRETPFSFLHQLKSAARRGDMVSIQHRSAALLASYFDVLFALNALPHPGEKRLVEYAKAHCISVPANFEASVANFVRAAASAPTDTEVISVTQVLLDGLEGLLTAEDKALLPACSS